MRIGFVQTCPVNGDVRGNLERAERLIGDGGGADVLVLPELFGTGYLHEDRRAVSALAESANGPTIDWARGISKSTGAAICGGFIWSDAGRLYNASFFAYDGKRVALYAKTHLFNREKLVFDEGPGPLSVFKSRGVAMGMMICFDWQFPEVARVLALDGAQILLHPSNLVLPWAQDAMRTRCLENGVFSITANRIGTEQDLRFTGGSRIVGPKGEILCDGPKDEEAVMAVDIDPALAADKKITERNDRRRDRRPELYARLTRPDFAEKTLAERDAEK
jgi:predicted amidohydrolase